MASGYLNTLKEHRKRHGAKGNGFGYMVVNDPNESGPYTAHDFSDRRLGERTQSCLSAPIGYCGNDSSR